jgi:uncharacterized protein with HEPN domain
MLPNEKNDLLYLLNILEYIGKIWKYTEEIICAEELYEFNSQMNLNASLTLLANIGENVSKISENLKNQYTNIEWKLLKNFRNRIVHDYGGLNLVIVYETITSDLKRLKSDIERIITEKSVEKIFEIEEIEICKDSQFYKYIDFDKIIK